MRQTLTFASIALFAAMLAIGARQATFRPLRKKAAPMFYRRDADDEKRKRGCQRKSSTRIERGVRGWRGFDARSREARPRRHYQHETGYELLLWPLKRLAQDQNNGMTCGPHGTLEIGRRGGLKAGNYSRSHPRLCIA